MSDVRGQLLLVYVLVDESGSMKGNIGQLNAGLGSLHEALLAEPMTAAKVRLSILGFSDDVAIRLHLADLRRVREMPQLMSRGGTSYVAAFSALQWQIPQDITQLKSQQYTVHRPVVIFLSDGQPTDKGSWQDVHRQLIDRHLYVGAPNIIACGIGNAKPQTILTVATRPEYAYVSVAGTDVGAAVAKFCTALTNSIVASGRSLGTAQAEIIFDKPESFRMAIDVI
jgi:uncharacterized protein YegL